MPKKTITKTFRVKQKIMMKSKSLLVNGKNNFAKNYIEFIQYKGEKYKGNEKNFIVSIKQLVLVDNKPDIYDKFNIVKIYKDKALIEHSAIMKSSTLFNIAQLAMEFQQSIEKI